MKNFTTFHFKPITLFVLIAFTALTSCKKTETADPTISYLRIINASPSLATYNAYFNGNMVNSAALPFGGAVNYLSYVAEAYSLKFTTASSAESLLTKTITLNASTYYSSYLINKPVALDVYTIGDDLSTPSTDKAYVRFINLSPDAPALDLAKTSATTMLVTNKAYKNASGFVAVDAGTYTLDAKETSSGAVKATSESTSFTAGYHYDIICGGLVAPANDTERPLSLQVIPIK
ncbi:DUF4397 domain-containing protein [Pedobacter sp. MR2016-19]|uniref:DUF4397 domain-containing protein n=1 Tax=Pedobacter sp. MR2016-19 TaxID=2780089 RepID=UPI0018752DE1|nr:DUF4397 domain-containing protein [Pedobacter sp. MR2016-19]MBE5320175.1 DUF4397 domain-containing protein [Pedobacter sp. MR2016-19]